MKMDTSNLLKTDGRVRELDGWRAISVSLVLLAHCFLQHPGFITRFPAVGTHIAWFGGLGVRTFFVISGFVIFRLLILEEARYGSVSLKAFYIRRACRILPPFYFYLALVSLLLFFGLINEHWDEIPRAAAFVTDFRLWRPGWFDAHSWSLSVEEQFYVIFPAIWVLAPKPLKGPVFVGVFLACTAWNFSACFAASETITSTTVRGGFVCISCGALMAIHEMRLRAIAARIPGFAAVLVALILFSHAAGSESWQEIAYESLILPPFIGLLLLFNMERGRWLRAFLLSKPAQAVGITSYGIYLWQQMFTRRRFEFSGAHEITSLMYPLLFLVVPLSYFVIEKPAIRLGKSLSQRARSSTISSTPLLEEPASPS